MARTAGFRTIRHGWKDWDYRPKPKPVAVALTPEELEEKRAAVERDTERFLAEMAAKSRGNGLTKLVDREARVSVEGDTDLNHDNVEG